MNTAEVKIKGPSSGEVLSKLLFFSVLILILPIAVYFGSKAFIFEGMMEMSSMNSYFYAAIVSIFTVHVILAMYIYVAWTEESKPYAKVE